MVWQNNIYLYKFIFTYSENIFKISLEETITYRTDNRIIASNVFEDRADHLITLNDSNK